MMTPFIWIAFAILGLIIEIGTPGLFFFLSFAFGACAAALCNSLNYSDIAQFIIFGITTLVSFLILKAWVHKQLSRKKFATNSDALIGKKIVVIEASTPFSRASAQINGDIWFVREVNNHALMQHDSVEVIAVQGSHLIVRKI